VVHLVVVGNDELVPGTLDGARRGRRRETQLSAAEVVERAHAQGGIAYAAHPGAGTSLLQSLLLARGTWSHTDMLTQRLDGAQAVNGAFQAQWRRARRLWIGALAAGRRLAVLAGNDAHGDFNRYRCIGKPFVSISENMVRHAGYTRTGLYGRPCSQADILAAVRAGKTFVTSGPYCALTAGGASEKVAVGERLGSADMASLSVCALSTPEYGGITEIAVFAGPRGGGKERVVFRRRYSAADSRYEVRESIGSGAGEDVAYVRAECRSVDAQRVVHVAATSAVYA